MMGTPIQSAWLPFNQTEMSATMRLFCFPYAGGNPVMFREWQAELPAWIEVCPVQLPGRGMRMQEPSYQEMKSLIQDMVSKLLPYLKEKPFTFFGHSLGALISFELCRYLQEHESFTPEKLIVSAYRGPHMPNPHPPIHHLPDAEFIDEVSKLGGLPEELRENPEYMELFLPSLRADFQLSETYQYHSRDPLQCPIVALGGRQDPEATVDELNAWEKQTRSRFQLYLFEGNHFFIHQQKQALLQIMRKEISC